MALFWEIYRFLIVKKTQRLVLTHYSGKFIVRDRELALFSSCVSVYFLTWVDVVAIQINSLTRVWFWQILIFQNLFLQWWFVSRIIKNCSKNISLTLFVRCCSILAIISTMNRAMLAHRLIQFVNILLVGIIFSKSKSLFLHYLNSLVKFYFN